LKYRKLPGSPTGRPASQFQHEKRF
jgi:hypothetical protein